MLKTFYPEHGRWICNYVRVSGWFSWKRLGLSITGLAGWVPAGSNWQKAFSKLLTQKLLGFSDQDLNLEVLCATMILWAGSLNIHLCPSHIGHVLRLPGAVSPDVLNFESLRITLTVSEVVGIENWVTSNLPLLLDPSSIAKMQSKSLVTDTYGFFQRRICL